MSGFSFKRSEGEMGAKRQTAVYTLLFAVTILGVLFVFWHNDKTMLRYTRNFPDSLAQNYAFLAGFKNYLASLFGGKGGNFSWAIGLGADAYSFYSSKLYNPLYWLVAALPRQFLDVGWSAMIVAYLYLSGVTFMLFLRKVGIRDYRVLIGAMCYVFAPWMILSSVKQGSFLIGAVMFPLLALSTEKILRRESVVPFILCVGFITLTSFRWPYTSGILIFFYFGVRYFLDYREPGTKGAFASRFGAFIGAGCIGILIAMPALLPTLMKLGKSTSASGMKTPLLFTLGQYLLFPSRVTNWDMAYDNYSFYSFLPLCAVMLPVVFYQAFQKKFAAVMSLLFTVLTQIPAFLSFLNFFSYPSGRWYCILIFFCVWACMEALAESVISRKKMRGFMGICFAVYTLYAFGFAGLYAGKALGLVSDNQILLMGANALFCALFLSVLFYRKEQDADFLKSARKRVVLVGLTALTAVLGYNVYFSQYSARDMRNFLSNGAAYKKFERSAQKAAQEITDDGFWRVDQVEGVDVTAQPRNRVNENVFFDTRSIYMFQSSNNSLWFDFGKFLGDNAIYYKRTCPNSNDNRMTPDLLTGVKYFLGDQKGSRKKASQYAGYGFEPWETMGGVEILKNKYSVGIGTLYTGYMKQSEAEKLNYAQREQAMLQAMILPDEEAGELEETLAAEGVSGTVLPELSTDDLETTAREVPFTVKSGRRAAVDEENRTITTDGRTGKFTLRIDSARDCQLLVSFEGLKKNGKRGEEEFTVFASKKGVVKAASDTIGNAQGFPDIDDLTINLGYFKNVKGRIKIRLKAEKAGVYSYDNIRVYAIPVDLYDKYASALQESALKLSHFGNDSVSGTFEAKQDSLAYFSVLNDEGWSVYVDGKKISRVEKANLAFVGAVIPKGVHTVELRYRTPGLFAGILLGIFGLLLLAGVIFINRRSGEKQK